MKVWLRRAGLAFGGLAALLLLALGGVYGMSASAVGTGHAAEPHPFDASIGNAMEGERLAAMYGCRECHTEDLGGQVMIDGMPFAVVPANNLTAGRPGGALTDEEFELAVRHGVGTDGRALFVMPSADYHYLSDQDVADILTYIRTVPPVERELPQRKFGPIGRTLTALGKVPFQTELLAADPDARHMEKPSATEPEQMGYYLTRLCLGCHGMDLAGAPPMDPSMPPGANLTPAGNLGNWTLEDFRTVFATGRTPEGKQLDPAFMPWNVIGGDAAPEEIDAIWAYLRTLESIERTFE
ncbi:MAG: c-type cytochrome [Gemmatimonadota bacterium]